MGSNAAGQLFGYTLQYPRALLRLLESDENAYVTIEEFGDVGVINSDGSKISEEDKSTVISKNPVYDTSTNLWKSFFNWINAIKEGSLVINRDRFILYSNFTPEENCLVYKFRNTNELNIEDRIKTARKSINDILKNPNHTSYKYVNTLFNNDIELFKKLLMHFEFVSDKKSDNVYNDIEKIVKNMLCLPNSKNIGWLLDSLTGWLQKEIMQKIAAGTQIIVSRQDLNKYMGPLIKKLLDNELIDYANSKMPKREDAEKRIASRPVYIRQMEYIDAETKDMVQAVLDYFRASENRSEWIENQLISEKDMKEFEENLFSLYENERKRIELTQKELTAEEKGLLLLINCEDKQISIINHDPPPRTVAGSYHVLADEQRLGWHPDWKTKLEKEVEHE